MHTGPCSVDTVMVEKKGVSPDGEKFRLREVNGCCVGFEAVEVL